MLQGMRALAVYVLQEERWITRATKAAGKQTDMTSLPISFAARTAPLRGATSCPGAPAAAQPSEPSGPKAPEPVEPVRMTHAQERALPYMQRRCWREIRMNSKGKDDAYAASQRAADAAALALKAYNLNPLMRKRHQQLLQPAAAESESYADEFGRMTEAVNRRNPQLRYAPAERQGHRMARDVAAGRNKCPRLPGSRGACRVQCHATSHDNPYMPVHDARRIEVVCNWQRPAAVAEGKACP
ncbi:hypothetical protein AK812_SmicGene34354 [Symbiodinium microadriaticum]|uniref:Uncharacterized protein n=1 Tax=Symbiodinium microadriaticum TaxID=2951 RepID=A0A1Q9CP81_SYMMI|nr:hypothetical protein AK812_SmicGene34354 [Symbiodinium microadriaticum]